jgi:formylglycine-generating enzyme required for sulfatase activity
VILSSEQIRAFRRKNSILISDINRSALVNHTGGGKSISLLNSVVVVISQDQLNNKSIIRDIFYREKKYKRLNSTKLHIIYADKLAHSSSVKVSCNASHTQKVLDNYLWGVEDDFRHLITSARHDEPQLKINVLHYSPDKNEKIEYFFKSDSNLEYYFIDSNVFSAEENSEILLNLFRHLPKFDYTAVLRVSMIRKNKKFLKLNDGFSGFTPRLRGVRFEGFANTSDIWQSDSSNFESKNSGSREDGLQQLAAARLMPTSYRSATILLEYFSSSDPSSTVRRAALSMLEDNQHFDSYKSPALLAQKIRQSPVIPKNILYDFREMFCSIPAGNFLMGSKESTDIHALREELPQHDLYVPHYEIMREPINKKLWNALGGVRQLGLRADNLHYPQTFVSWFDCMKAAQQISHELRLAGLIGGDEVVVLPSEAEWEKAARGTAGQIYPWGNKMNKDICNCRESGFNKILSSGFSSPQSDSPYGIVDMAGNIWQWTRSLWGESLRQPTYKYPYKIYDGRENLYAGPHIRRVIRGGAFYYFDYCVRSATRNSMFPNTRHHAGGARYVIATVDAMFGPGP